LLQALGDVLQMSLILAQVGSTAHSFELVHALFPDTHADEGSPSGNIARSPPVVAAAVVPPELVSTLPAALLLFATLVALLLVALRSPELLAGLLPTLELPAPFALFVGGGQFLFALTQLS